MDSDTSFKSYYISSTGRPPSPRTEMNDYQIKNRDARAATSARPLNRYLDEIDVLTNSSEDAEMIEQEWKKLRDLRASVLRHRAKLRSKRGEVIKCQRAKDRADDTFMKYVRDQISPEAMVTSSRSGQGGPSLSEILAALQETRDNYGPVADSYNLLEDLVDKEEFEMAKLEGQLYKTKIPAIAVMAENTSKDTDIRLQTTLSDSLLGLSAETPDEYPPLHANYLSKLGDLDLAMEQHHIMMQEHEKLVSLVETRRTLGIELDEAEIEFLGSFPTRETASLGDIVKIKESIKRAKEKCLEEGIEIDEGSYGSFEQDSEDGIEGEINSADEQVPEKETAFMSLSSDHPPPETGTR